MTEAMAATGRYHVFQTNERPPYFVGIMDDVVQIGVGEDGEPRAVVESTDPEVKAWAERVFERYRRRGTRVEPTEATSSAGESATE